MRMNCDAFLIRARVVDDSGIEEIRWQRPVRPGDRLHVRRRTLAGRSRDHLTGEVEFLYEIVDQDGLVAMTQRSLVVFERRHESGGDRAD
jgi:acyl dehydratase